MADDLTEALRDSPLFERLGADEVRRIVELGRVEYWREGALVFEEGAVGPRLMVILEGEVEILRRDASGKQRQLASLGHGEVLGDLSLLLDLPRTATVRAQSALRVFAVDRAAYEQMVNSGDPAALKLGLELARVLAARLVHLSERVVDLLMQVEGGQPLQEKFGEARQEIFNLWE